MYVVITLCTNMVSKPVFSRRSLPFAFDRNGPVLNVLTDQASVRPISFQISCRSYSVGLIEPVLRLAKSIHPRSALGLLGVDEGYDIARLVPFPGPKLFCRFKDATLPLFGHFLGVRMRSRNGNARIKCNVFESDQVSR